MTIISWHLHIDLCALKDLLKVKKLKKTEALDFLFLFKATLILELYQLILWILNTVFHELFLFLKIFLRVHMTLSQFKVNEFELGFTQIAPLELEFIPKSFIGMKSNH